MRTRVRVFGHPLHQMLVPVPLGLFVVASVLDLVHSLHSASWMPGVSYWNAAIGVCAALVAALFGFIAWTSIPSETRARRIGALHGLGNVVVTSLFAVAVYLRHEHPADAAPTAALGLELGGLALGAVTAWLGGELVDRMGVGVDEGANLNAPSSLTHETV